MRITVFSAGVACLAFAWLAPLASIVRGPFSAHMVMHMVVVALASPLIALAVAGRRFDPVQRWPAWFPPIAASVVELIAVWAWHAPGLHHWARTSSIGFALEQGSFLASGLFVWLAAFGGAPASRGARIAQGGLALLLTSMHMTLLGALLALPPRALYAGVHHAHPEVHGGLDPLDDQQLGGAIMLIAGGVAYLSGGLALAVELLRARRREGGKPRPSW